MHLQMKTEPLPEGISSLQHLEMIICNTSRVFPSTREPARAVIGARSPSAGTGPPAHTAGCCSQRDPPHPCSCPSAPSLPAWSCRPLQSQKNPHLLPSPSHLASCEIPPLSLPVPADSRASYRANGLETQQAESFALISMAWILRLDSPGPHSHPMPPEREHHNPILELCCAPVCSQKRVVTAALTPKKGPYSSQKSTSTTGRLCKKLVLFFFFLRENASIFDKRTF